MPTDTESRYKGTNRPTYIPFDNCSSAAFAPARIHLHAVAILIIVSVLLVSGLCYPEDVLYKRGISNINVSACGLELNAR